MAQRASNNTAHNYQTPRRVWNKRIRNFGWRTEQQSRSNNPLDNPSLTTDGSSAAELGKCVMRFKITAIIGLVAVALVGCVRPAKMDELAMTIRAIGPTGETWYKPPQPIWNFSIRMLAISAP